MIGSYSPWFGDELVKRVTEEKIRKAVDLAKGAAGDFADYRYACGVLDGLDLALEIADEIKKELDAA